MKYNVLEKSVVNGQTAMAVYEKETIEDARSMFHQIMASAYANNNLTFILCEIINDYGNVEVSEIYENPIPGPIEE